MSLPIRSDRKIDLELDRTPAAVGPGSYTAHAEYTVPKSLVPFATSGQRSDLVSNVGLPGPGQYASDGWTDRPKTASNKLGGGGPRLVPVGTGDTGYGQCTYIKNPGVGQYNLDNQGPGMLESKRQDKLRSEPKRQFSSGDLRGGPGMTPVAIPVPGKHFGYDMDEVTGEIKLHPVPFVTHKGTVDDRVGPGHYASEKIPKDADKVVRFGNSRTRRSPFAPSFDPTKTLGPGPAGYALTSSVQANSSKGPGGTSSFLSTTPMAHEVRPRTTDHLPRPGSSAYADMGSVHTTNTNRRRPARGPRARQVPFGTSAARENTVVRNAQTPFTAPHQMCTPGPGTYGQVRKVSWLTSQLQARAQRDAQQALEEKKMTRKIPRGASQESEAQETTPAAPKQEELGTLSVYTQGGAEEDDGGPTRPFTAVGFIREAVPRSVFGSTAKKTSIFEEESARVAYQPGPGTYRPMQTDLERREREDQELLEYQAQVEEAVRLQLELQLDPTPETFMMDPVKPRLTPKMIIKRRQKPTSSFMTGSKRLSSYAEECDPDAPLTTNPHFANAPQRAVGASSPMREAVEVPSAAFQSSTKRFSGPDSAFGNVDHDIPGPAAYGPALPPRLQTPGSPQNHARQHHAQLMRHRNHRASAQTPSQDGRGNVRPSSFVPKSQTAATCGPGAYAVSGSLVKRSFNVTMTNGKAALRKWEAKRSAQQQQQHLRALQGSLVSGMSSSMVESMYIGTSSTNSASLVSTASNNDEDTRFLYDMRG
ncbi:Sperm-tail PG-rich repeat-containing protein 2 [Hondaea fermentalgiana]|uniref:Sperm-tail PG-rich repeat-containing protein 2 n=1 Tax=Hondaea fermentalgiana TaxID=2315210 RepID=A0A2R5GN61_9STRA|nr:Sperm-tail PG-rich repeat-containing protein 2 [Hondaea fermentalgiana]|eukprot:GBG29304.1 Sperm-tail PG-rich repeat-containing protein 2 [Hondaea fermentalgiana]